MFVDRANALDAIKLPKISTAGGGSYTTLEMLD
jgi:hypothetical protein